MILARHSLETNAAPEAVWRRWVDVGTWPDWDRALEGAGIDGISRPHAAHHLRSRVARRGTRSRQCCPVGLP